MEPRRYLYLQKNLSKNILELEKLRAASRIELALVMKALPKHLRDLFYLCVLEFRHLELNLV